MGAFGHLEWTYDEAFQQLFGLGESEQKSSKNSNARGGCPGRGRGGCLSFDWCINMEMSFVIVAVGVKSRLFSFVTPKNEGDELSSCNPFSRIKN